MNQKDANVSTTMDGLVEGPFYKSANILYAPTLHQIFSQTPHLNFLAAPLIISDKSLITSCIAPNMQVSIMLHPNNLKLNSKPEGKRVLQVVTPCWCTSTDPSRQQTLIGPCYRGHLVIPKSKFQTGCNTKIPMSSGV